MKKKKSQPETTVHSASGIPLAVSYNADTQLGEKVGEFPYSRGIHKDMYRGRCWTMRQYAGFGSAKATNERYHYLIKQGVSGLSVAFDLPTQMGLDADSPRAAGEVGRVGVSISSMEDMRTLLKGIPLEDVSISMTINSTASILLAMLLIVAEERGVPWTALRGTIQNDSLKEYIARGTYIFPPKAALKITTDIFAFCQANVPQWNTISISGYHIREAGATAIQELGLTFANAIAYIEAALAAGLDIDDFAPRLAFFFNCQIHFFEEIAKFRAARRIWAHLMQDRFGAKNERSMKLRFHTQTAGSSLTAQEPRNNIVRTTVEALAAVLGGTQSLHTNGYDEALQLPTEESALIALRTQQILAQETGIGAVADPLGGSYFIEHLTSAIEQGALELITIIDGQGGMLAAIESGFAQEEIERSAFDWQQRLESKDVIVVGVNAYREKDSIDAQELENQPSESLEVGSTKENLRIFKSAREQKMLLAAKQQLTQAFVNEENCVGAIVTALKADLTLGEIADCMRGVFGEFR